MSGGNELAWSACEIFIMELMRKDDTEELNDTGEEQISFSGKGVGGFSVCNAQCDLECVYGAFHGGSAVVGFRKLQ